MTVDPNFEALFASEGDIIYRDIYGYKVSSVTIPGSYTVIVEAKNDATFFTGEITLGTIDVTKKTPTPSDFNKIDNRTIVLDQEGYRVGNEELVTTDNRFPNYTVSYLNEQNEESEHITKPGKYRIQITVDSGNDYYAAGKTTLDTIITAVDFDYTSNLEDSYDYSGQELQIEIGGDEALYGKIDTVIEKSGVEVNTAKDVGTYEVYAQNAGTTYCKATKTHVGTFDIKAQKLTITAPDVTLQQGDTLPSVSVTYAGFVAGENAGTIFDTLPAAKYLGDSSKVGKTTIKAVSGTEKAEAKNYDINYKSGTLTVNGHKIDETFYDFILPTDRVYDGKVPEMTIASKGEDLGTISPIFKQDGKEIKSPNVGTYQVYARNSGSDKYNGADTLLGEFTITAKPLTISVVDVEVKQNELLPDIIINYIDFAEGEDADTIFSELPTGEYVGDSSKVGTSAIEINEGTKKVAADNYEISYVAGTLTVTENGSSGEEEEQDRLPVYRVYNPNNGEHLYTLSQEEATWLIEDVGLNDEGISWQAGEKTGKAVYRLYNQNSGEHFYTLDQGEYESVGRLGWRQEGVAFYAAEDTNIPIYRVFNPNSQDAGSHHYTLSTTENTWLVRQGWKSEGVGFYGK